MPEGKEALFVLQEMEVELTLVAANSVTAEGRTDVWVLSGKLDKSDESEVTQTVRLTYKVAPAVKGTSQSGDRFHSSAETEEERIVEALPKISS